MYDFLALAIKDKNEAKWCHPPYGQLETESL